MLDHHSLLLMLRNRGDADKSKRKVVNDLLNPAGQNLRIREDTQAHEKSRHWLMNSSNQWIRCQELLLFMRQQGHSQLRRPHFHKEIDRDGNGSFEQHEWFYYASPKPYL